MTSRSFATSSSVRSFTLVSGLIPVFFEDLVGTRSADTVDIGQTDFHTLGVRDVNTGNTSHFYTSLLSLPLFMLGVFAYYHDFALTFDYFALLANFLDGRLDFHFMTIPFSLML